MLRLEGISVAYGKHEALHDVTLEIESGRTTVILGANGAGKTTLLKTIAGLVRAKPGGRILFDGRPIQDDPPHEIVSAGIALVPEGRRLFGEMTVVENLRLGAYPEHARADEEVQLEKMFALFPRLAERRTQLARTMSGGEQQMLAVARALMSEPKILLLDEPSLGLSPRLVKELFATIRQITEEGQSVVLVEQNANQSLRLADRVFVLENGHIRASGTPQDIQQDQVIQQAYLGREAKHLVDVPTAPPLAPAAPASAPVAKRAVETVAAQPAAGPASQLTIYGPKPAPGASSSAPAIGQPQPAQKPPIQEQPHPSRSTEIETEGGFVNPFARTVTVHQRKQGLKDQETMVRSESQTTSSEFGSRPTSPPFDLIHRSGGFVNPYARSVSYDEPKPQVQAEQQSQPAASEPVRTAPPQTAPAQSGGFVNPQARKI